MLPSLRSMPRLLRPLLAVALAGAAAAALPAHAEPAPLRLVASSEVTFSGEAVVLEATSTRDVEDTPYYYSIWENETGRLVAQCGNGLGCGGEVAHDGGTYTYTAYIGSYATAPPPADVQAQSESVRVTWAEAGTVPCVSEVSLVACVRPQSQFMRAFVRGPLPHEGLSAHVAGYLDLYAFTQDGVSVTLPCVVLNATNPCDATGGSYVRRLATLMYDDLAVRTATLAPYATVGVCRATLTFTVDGVGINAAPAYTTC